MQWRHLFGTRTFAEVKYSGWWGYYYLDPLVNSPASFDGSTGPYSGGAGGFGYYADRTRNQVNASISHYAEAFGKHDLKFGVEIERSSVHSQYGWADNIYYYDYTAYYPKGAVPRLQLRLRRRREVRPGVPLRPGRVEAHRPADHQRRRPGGLHARPEHGARQDGLHRHQLGPAPRLRLRRDRRRQDRREGPLRPVLRGASYADQYYSAVPGWKDFVGYATTPAATSAAPPATASPRSTGRPLPALRVDPDIKHPRVDEWTAGIERELIEGRPPLGDRHLAQGQEHPGLRLPRRTVDRLDGDDRDFRRRPHAPGQDGAGLQLGQPRPLPRRTSCSRTRTASCTATRTGTSSAWRAASGRTRG